ncbi:hypothetical protein F7R91_21895 [Streptomyces luteolifulvus]|uniref:Uncharacterized protein n=1 Tax=Streptomyces luteolifulvus TaxID=2615112 RepID=A0A6H9UZ27_9ACTN|nr:hypothetical protein [Streptomyces luteolifulvus]KAB1144470.1 hypothetical protein F7R91_21895 [Streptomyces luteolifulvus]
MAVVDWDDMAEQDLHEATDDPDVRREFMDLAETELRYPPHTQNSDEGFAVQYNRGYAYRRALRRHTPTRSADLAGDPAVIDDGGFPYGTYLYIYRPPTKSDLERLNAANRKPKLVVRRLLHEGRLAAELGPSTIQ